MYNKIVELCHSLNKMKPGELRKEGVEGLIIYCLNTDPTHHVDFIKGEATSVLAMLGSALSYVAKAGNIPLKDMLDMIYDAETEIEKFRKKKEEGE